MPVKASKRPAAKTRPAAEPAKPKAKAKANVIHVWRHPGTKEFYWHAHAANGKLVAIGGESFKRRGDVTKSKLVAVLVAAGYTVEDNDHAVPRPATIMASVMQTQGDQPPTDMNPDANATAESAVDANAPKAVNIGSTPVNLNQSIWSTREEV